MLRCLLIASMNVLLGCGGSHAPSATMSDSQEQTVSEPGSADLDRLARQRKVVEQLVAGDRDRAGKLETVAGKLGAIRAILDGQVLKADQTYELQCLGIVLGDAFVLELGMEWVMVEDDYGRDPAVRLPGTTIMLFPLTMISKRVERGESVDVFDLFNGVAATVDKLKREGR